MQTVKFELTMTTKDGVEVPVKIEMEYPDNQGMLAWEGFRHTAEEGTGMMINALINSGDTSLLEAMAKQGMSVEDVDDDGN